MSGLFRVEFLGLTGLVPRKGDGGFLAALPDLSYGIQTEPIEGRIEQIPPHVPVIIVPTDSIIQSWNTAPAMTFQTKGGPFAGRSFSMFLLRNERVRVNGLVGDNLAYKHTKINPEEAGTLSPSVNVEELQWVPSMSLANGGGRDVGKFNHEEFLNADETPAESGDVCLAATVVVDRGRLYVGDVRRAEGVPIMYEFKVPEEEEPEWSQAVFSSLYWDAEISRERISIEFLPSYTEDRPAGQLDLRSLDGMCEMWVANLELETLLGVGRSAPRMDLNADIDSSVFYLFSKNTPDPGTGMPVAHEPDRGIAAGGSALCIPMMFDS